MNDDVWKVVVAVLTLVVTSLFGGSALYRRFSKDKVAVAADSSDIAHITRLNADIARREAERITDIARWMAERRELIERADRINEERNAAVEQIGALRQQVHDLSAKVLELSGHVERVERIAEAHKEVAEGLRRQLSAFMKIHEVGGDKRDE
jgi:seryl-tRNA synthetase